MEDIFEQIHEEFANSEDYYQFLYEINIFEEKYLTIIK